MDIFRVGKCNLIVVKRVPGMRNNVSSTSASCLDGMRLKGPVADIDQMDRLFDDNIAGQREIPVPTADSEFVRGHVWHRGITDTGRVVICSDGADFSQGACLNTTDELDEGRRAADLETNFEAHMPLGTFANLQSLFCLGDIHSYRLLAVDMLAAPDSGIEMLHMKPGWS